MKIKRRKADILYSIWLRKKRPHCERCNSQQSLQVSHFFGRANENLRFDPRNTDCLCFSCHQYFTANPNEYVVWKSHRMGSEYNKLVLDANIKKKKDDVIIILWLSQELTKMGIPQKEEKPKKYCIHNGKKYVSEFCALCLPRKKSKKQDKKNIEV